jgi:hypothetical protein
LPRMCLLLLTNPGALSTVVRSTFSMKDYRSIIKEQAQQLVGRRIQKKMLVQGVARL